MSARLLAAAVFSATAGACAAQPAPKTPPAVQVVQPSAIFTQRAEEMIEVFNGQRELVSIAATPFPGKRTKEEVSAIVRKTFDRIRARSGPALAVSRIEAKTPYVGDVYVTLEKTQVRMALTVEDKAPHMVLGFGISSQPAAKAGSRRR